MTAACLTQHDTAATKRQKAGEKSPLERAAFSRYTAETDVEKKKEAEKGWKALKQGRTLNTTKKKLEG